jgi:xanthine dehydrogenase accessory factor
MIAETVVVRGGGDVATGTIHRLFQAGYRVFALETEKPTVIRRTVAVAQCVFSGKMEIEGLRAQLADSPAQAIEFTEQGVVPVLIDPAGISIGEIHPDIVVDAIMAKRNLGTNLAMAQVVIGLGPGFTAGKDVHAVVETKRGHYLGKVYYQGEALPNTGEPGEIGGASRERIVRAPADGSFFPEREIGERVLKGETLGFVEGVPVISPLTGVIRGLIHDGLEVNAGMKIGDIDPREVGQYCWSISDKARAVGGGVLEAILHLTRNSSATL